MKVTENTPERLIIEHTPWLLAIALASLMVIFIGIGLAPLGQLDEPLMWLFSFLFIFVGGGLWFLMLELFARRLQYILDRPSDRIILRRRSVLKHRETRHQLSRLIEARVERNMADSGQTLMRPVLILRSTSKGGETERRIPMHEYFTNGQGPEAMVEAINLWLSRQR